MTDSQLEKAESLRRREDVGQLSFRKGYLKENPEYRFLSKSAQGATRKYGVRSVSLLAVKA
jgi:hypothetical protein